MATLKILGVHGIGDHHSNLAWEEEWKSAIEGGLRRWSPGIECEFPFLLHDAIFDKYPISAMDVAEAVVKLGASGIFHSIGDALRDLGYDQTPCLVGPRTLKRTPIPWMAGGT